MYKMKHSGLQDNCLVNLWISYCLAISQGHHQSGQQGRAI